MSGGVDSSYLCYIAKEITYLRPLVYCVATGWNLNVVVENIERIVKALDLDMYTEVIDWREMRDLHLAVKLATGKLYGSSSGISTPDGMGKGGSLYGRRVFCSDMTFDATVNPEVWFSTLHHPTCL